MLVYLVGVEEIAGDSSSKHGASYVLYPFFALQVEHPVVAVPTEEVEKEGGGGQQSAPNVNPGRHPQAGGGAATPHADAGGSREVRHLCSDVPRL
jgi:hypothetical protein